MTVKFFHNFTLIDSVEGRFEIDLVLNNFAKQNRRNRNKTWFCLMRDLFINLPLANAGSLLLTLFRQDFTENWVSF